MADFDPDRLQTEPAPDETQYTRVTPQRKKAGPRPETENGQGGYNPEIVTPTMGHVLDFISGGESGGKYNVIYGGKTFDDDKDHPRIAVPITSGPNKGKTSSAAGKYQFIGSTWDAVANKTGRHDFKKDSQDANAVWLAKDTYKKQTGGRDLEQDWASGDPELKKGIRQALATQWESLGAGPRVSKLGKADDAGPSRGYGFSDYALKEHADRPDTSIHWMSPEDYLGLSPEFKEKPFESASGRSLMKSFQKGDHIESIPTLDVNVDGDTATVTEQDGRHRALLAQQEGVKEIPVAVRGIGENSPSQIAGMRGDKRPLELPARQARQEGQQQQKEPISLLREIGNAVIPSAHAEGVPDWANENAHPAQQAQAPQQGGQTPDWAQEAPAAPAGGGKPVAQMSQEEAQAANLSPQQQREWIDAQNKEPVGAGLAAAAGRGVAPYAVGAGIGAGLGAAGGLGVGAIPGAAMGAGAVMLDQLASGVTGKPEPVQQATNKLLDMAGVRKPETAAERITEQAAGAAASGFAGGEFAGALSTVMKTPGSKVAANYLMNRGAGMAKTVSEIAGKMAEGPMQQAIAGASSGAAAQLAAEAGLPPWMQTMVGLAAGLVPGGRGAMPNMRHIDASPAAKKAIEQGFAIPPAEASEGHVGKFNPTNALAAEGGKVKLQQLASAQNQIVVNRKVATELGLPPETELMPDVYKQVRAREGKVYNEVESAVPEITLNADPIFRDEIADIGKPSESTERNFPSTKAPPGIAALKAEATAKSVAPTGDVKRYVADLRSRATANFQAHGEGAAMAHRMGFAERETADALEGAMERSIQNAPQYYRAKLSVARKARDEAFRERAEQGLPLQGPVIDAAEAEVQGWSDRLANANAKNQDNQTLLDRFKGARRMMAKSYDAEAVTNPSNGAVSATGLGRLKQRGRPLSGALEEIADAANNFRKAFQNPSAFGGVEPLSILDAAFVANQGAKAIAHAAHGNIAGFLAHLAAGAGTMMRPLTRESILSPKNQNRMIQPRGNFAGMPLGGVMGALLPTQDPGGNALMGLGQVQP